MAVAEAGPPRAAARPKAAAVRGLQSGGTTGGGGDRDGLCTAGQGYNVQAPLHTGILRAPLQWLRPHKEGKGEGGGRCGRGSQTGAEAQPLVGLPAAGALQAAVCRELCLRRDAGTGGGSCIVIAPPRATISPALQAPPEFVSPPFDAPEPEMVAGPHAPLVWCRCSGGATSRATIIIAPPPPPSIVVGRRSSHLTLVRTVHRNNRQLYPVRG